ncbi:MAG: hypothetical protein U0269_23010 [Polyangiales bacterium]
MRARQAQFNLAMLRKRYPAAAERVRASIPREIEAIERAGMTDWVDFAALRALLEGALRELGEAEFRRWCSSAMTDTLQGPLLRTLWDSSVRLFGLRPESILRWAPQAWALMYRDLGTVEWSSSERCLKMTRLDAAAYASNAFLESAAAAVDAVFSLCNERVSTVVERRDSGTAVLRA